MKIFTLIFLIAFTFSFGQSGYKKISESKINTERLRISKDFIDSFLTKCTDKNYSEFKGFHFSKKMELFYKEDYQKSCEKSENIYGKIDILKFNSVYLNKRTVHSDPLELFVYEAKTEKDPKIKYVSVWMYRDQNYINGIWISKEKPIR